MSFSLQKYLDFLWQRIGKDSKLISYEKVNMNVGSHFIKFLIWAAKLNTISLCAQVMDCLSPCSSFFKCTAAWETFWVSLMGNMHGGHISKRSFYLCFLMEQHICMANHFKVIVTYVVITWNLSLNQLSVYTLLLTEKIPLKPNQREGVRLLVTELNLLVPGTRVPFHTVLEYHFFKSLHRWKVVLTLNSSGSFWRNRTGLPLLLSFPFI